VIRTVSTHFFPLVDLLLH